MLITRIVKELKASIDPDRAAYLSARMRVAVPLPATRFMDLTARFYGTDKNSRAHNNTELYVHHMLPRRRQVRTLLEIGIGGVTSRTGFDTPAGGQSLRMWESFFPNAQIVGIDIEDSAVRGRRIATEKGSQDDPEFLAWLAAKHGPFDIVIDDGSHVAEHVQTSFECLFEHVRPGGIYVIEDLEHAYLEDYGGGPAGSNIGHMGLLKDLLDHTLQRQWIEPGGTAWPVESVHLYDEIAFVYKSRANPATLRDLPKRGVRP